MNSNLLERTPLVSVVIPAYNCEAYIEEAINSILFQTYTNLEIVIADDGSDDNTRALIDSFVDPRIRRFHNAGNIGNIRTRNKLFDLACGEYITIQDADDWSHPERLEKQILSFENDVELGACGTNFFNVQLDRQLKPGRKLEKDILLKPGGELYLWPPSIMVRREVYESIGGLNLYFDGLYEDKYWINLIREKHKVICLKEALYYYRFNPVSLTKKLGKPRKLLLHTLIDELLRQRRETGADWLEQGDFKKLQEYENRLLQDKKWLSEQYRVFSAVSIDGLKLKEARRLLYKAIKIYPFNHFHLNTIIYLIKTYINHTLLKKNFCE